MGIDSFKIDGTTYFELFMSCPICTDRGHIVASDFWFHSTVDEGCECDGCIYIGDNARFFCKKCQKSAHVTKWRYSCPDHTPDIEINKLKEADFIFAQVIPIVGQMVTCTGMVWLSTFLKNLDLTIE